MKNVNGVIRVMEKDKQKGSKTGILLAGVAGALLVLLIYVLFAYCDLAHKIELISYTKISTYEELQAISAKPDGKYYLACDIDLAGKDWTPFTFNGIFDGNSHEIMNLRLDKPGAAVRDTFDGNMKSYPTSLVGMFDVVEGATIRDLTLSSVYADITSDKPCFVGTLAGYVGNSKIIGCSVKGEVYLRAHDRMFGVGGVAGYGYGRFENVSSDVTLVCIDTDRLTKDEQFMGGLIGAGYPDCINCTINIDGYGSEHGYAHNGGLTGLYMFYPKGTTHDGIMKGNRIYGKITFFEENDDRRAYCKALIGEDLSHINVFEDNGADFRTVEVYNYDADLLPGEHSRSFDFAVSAKGRYELKAEYENNGADATYGLFINGRFYKKAFFPKGSGTITEQIFLDEGKADVKFRFLPGDGNIDIKNASIERSQKSVSLIVAPHPDDEILAFAGTIQQTLAEGNIVKVVFLTNGDYYGEKYTSVRIAESISALSLLGVGSSDITVLGYGDLTLKALLEAQDPEQVFGSAPKIIATYGASPLNVYDYHTMNTGSPAGYSAANLKADLSDYLLACRPDRVYTTSEYEWHTDHKFAFLLVRDTLKKLSGETAYHPVLCESVIHGEDKEWPGKLSYDSDSKPVITRLTNPFPTMKTNLDWNSVKRVDLTDEQLRKKSDAIGKFVSQNEPNEDTPGTKEYNYSFCKRDEIYWEISY